MNKTKTDLFQTFFKDIDEYKELIKDKHFYTGVHKDISSNEAFWNLNPQVSGSIEKGFKLTKKGNERIEKWKTGWDKLTYENDVESPRVSKLVDELFEYLGNVEYTPYCQYGRGNRTDITYFLWDKFNLHIWETTCWPYNFLKRPRTYWEIYAGEKSTVDNEIAKKFNCEIVETNNENPVDDYFYRWKDENALDFLRFLKSVKSIETKTFKYKDNVFKEDTKEWVVEDIITEYPFMTYD